MSSLDLRARLKRELSFSSTNSLSSLSSHGSSMRAPKRWRSSDGCAYQRKVSFGHLNETVLFDNKDSSNNLSLGVSVSNSSFSSMRQRSSANVRWGEERPASRTGNATWGIPSPQPQDARWQCTLTSSRPNMFSPSSSTRSSATANAFSTIAPHQSGNTQKNTPIFSCPQQQRPAFPTRSPSPTQDSSMEDVQRGLTRSCSLMAPPRRPGRCASPVNEDIHRGVTRSSSLIAPPRRPGRCASPVTILPEPIQKKHTPVAVEEGSVTPIFGMPPKLPVRSTSPVTVTPRSSFNLGQDGDINL